jgi:hypothetical protein
MAKTPPKHPQSVSICAHQNYKYESRIIMAETKVCKQCGKYNMRDADNCIQCRKALPEFALPTNVIKTRGQLSIIFGMAVGIIVVLNTLGISTILFGVYVGGYGGLLAWILVFKFRNNFPDDLTSTLNWLFPFRKMNLLKFIGVWIAVAIISIVFSVIASM